MSKWDGILERVVAAGKEVGLRLHAEHALSNDDALVVTCSDERWRYAPWFHACPLAITDPAIDDTQIARLVKDVKRRLDVFVAKAA